MSDDFLILQAARLKGRPTEADLLAATGLEAGAVAGVVAALTAAGHLEPAGTRFKVTAAGRAALDAELAAERATVDRDALTALYHDGFTPTNTAFKQLVTDWQLIDGTRPNDHSDPAYDAKIVDRLAELHRHFTPQVERIVALVPRLAGYRDRLAAALAKVVAGEHTWLARPLVDSYHTVWFELHEELIGLAGLSRAAEAAAGRAE